MWAPNSHVPRPDADNGHYSDADAALDPDLVLTPLSPLQAPNSTGPELNADKGHSDAGAAPDPALALTPPAPLRTPNSPVFQLNADNGH